MRKFNILYESILKSLIKEGGNAVPGVDRIKRRFIQKTIDDFKQKVLNPIFGFDVTPILFTLGSTGKKNDSGDIDLAIDESNLKGSTLYHLMKINQKCAALGLVSCINTMNYKMIHIAYPQIGENKKKVQIDVLFTKYPDFCKFFMWSPTKQESKYKGAHRNQILHAICKVTTFHPLQKNEIGEVVRWTQKDVTEDGYYSMVKTLIDDAGNRLKYKSTNEDLEPQYARNEEQYSITHNVDEVIQTLFGNGFDVNNIDTFEKCFDIVKNNYNFKFRNQSEEILKECAKSLKNKESRLEFPKELKEYINEKQ